MKRSASEVIRNLESRIARLEGKSKTAAYNTRIIDGDECVILMNFNSHANEYCFTHLYPSTLKSAVSSFMSDMVNLRQMGIVSNVKTISSSKVHFCVEVEINKAILDTDAELMDRYQTNMVDRPNTVIVG
jgi:hypothetical protein